METSITVSPKDDKILNNQPEIKDSRNNIVEQYIKNLYSIFTDILLIIVDIWLPEELAMNVQEVGDFLLVSRAIMAGARTPLTEN